MNQGDGSVTRIDGRSGERPRPFAVTGGAIGGGDLTTGAGAVWLRTDTAVARIDPASRAVTHLIDLPPGSGSVAATDRRCGSPTTTTWPCTRCRCRCPD